MTDPSISELPSSENLVITGYVGGASTESTETILLNAAGALLCICRARTLPCANADYLYGSSVHASVLTRGWVSGGAAVL